VFKLQRCWLSTHWVQWGLYVDNNDSYACWVVYCYEMRHRHWREHTGKKLDFLLSFIMPNDKIVFLVSYHFHLRLGLKWYDRDGIYVFVKSSIQWHKEFLNYVAVFKIWRFKFIVASTANTRGSLMSSSTFICLRFLLQILLYSCNKILLICVAFGCRLNGYLLWYNLSALQ